MKKAIFLFTFLLLFGPSPARAQENEAAPKAAAEASGEKPKYEVQLQYSEERLTRGLGVWRSASVYAERRFADRKIVWGQYRASDRRGERDREFVGGLYQPFGKKWAVTAEAMFSPTRRYVGKFSVMGEAERQMGRGFVAHFGGRYTAYTTVRAATAYGLAEKYWGGNRAAYTLYVTRLTNAGTAPTHRLQYNRYWGENSNSVGAAVSFGREHENLGPNLGILRSRTWSVSVSGRFWLTNRFGLNVDGLVHRQGDLYYRRGFNFGLRYRF